MIIHQNFLWLHLPRTGGTATSSWLQKINIALQLNLAITPQDQRAKHDNLLIRNFRADPIPEFKTIVMNFRSLPDWLLSNYYFALYSGLNVPIDRYISGEFFSLRVGKWCQADWWLEYFEIERVSYFMRSDHLENDWRNFLYEQCNLIVPKEIQMIKENEIQKKNNASLIDFDWTEAYKKNTKWRILENKVLGLI